MRTCPSCHQVYADETMKFCLADGAQLVGAAEIETAYSPVVDPTLLLPSRLTVPAPTVLSPRPVTAPQPTITTAGIRPSASVTPLGGNTAAANGAQRSKAPLWILVALILGGSAIGIALIVTRDRPAAQSAAPNATPTETPAGPKEVRLLVSSQRMWTDTGMDLRQGDRVHVTATSLVTATTDQNDAAYKWVGPDGWGYQPEFNLGGEPAHWVLVLGAKSSMEAMIGKVAREGAPFKVGSSYDFTAQSGGRLYLGVNHVISDHTGKIIHSLDETGLIWPGSSGAFNTTVRVDR